MPNDCQAVLDLECRRQAALINVDMQALTEMFAEDLVHIHSNAMVQNKQELLDHIEQRRAFVAVERGPLTVRVFGDLAILTGRILNRMRHDGKLIELTGFVTQVARRDGGDWRFVNFQFTPDPKA